MARAAARHDPALRVTTLTYKTWVYQTPLFKENRIRLDCPHCGEQTWVSSEWFYGNLRSLLNCKSCDVSSKLPDIGVL